MVLFWKPLKPVCCSYPMARKKEKSINAGLQLFLLSIFNPIHLMSWDPQRHHVGSYSFGTTCHSDSFNDWPTSNIWHMGGKMKFSKWEEALSKCSDAVKLQLWKDLKKRSTVFILGLSSLNKKCCGWNLQCIPPSCYSVHPFLKKRWGCVEQSGDWPYDTDSKALCGQFWRRNTPL